MSSLCLIFFKVGHFLTGTLNSFYFKVIINITVFKFTNEIFASVSFFSWLLTFLFDYLLKKVTPFLKFRDKYRKFSDSTAYRKTACTDEHWVFTRTVEKESHPASAAPG